MSVVAADETRVFIISALRAPSAEHNVEINVRTTMLTRFHGIPFQSKGPGEEHISIKLEDHLFIGPGGIILPNVVIGRGSAVAAGNVVTKNIPPMTLVQGTPDVPVARCGIPLAGPGEYKEFLKRLKPCKP
jgi:acetyltransferase-like isoleucine patch superfamily enzyme